MVKNKTLLIISAIMCVLLFVTPALAVEFPMPINGRVTGEYVYGQDIIVTNVRTAEMLSTSTNSAGEWLVDWANSEQGFRHGDKFLVKLSSCDAARCSETVVWNGEASLYVSTPLEASAPCNSWVQTTITGIMGLLVGLIVFMGGGIKIYKNRAGKAVLQHRHKGIRSYHDVNIKHSDPRYSHRRFKDNPVGFVTDVTKIEREGRL